MSLTLTVPDDIAEAVNRQSQQSGIAPEQLLLNALQTQFSSVPAELQTQFDALSTVSDEELVRFASQSHAPHEKEAKIAIVNAIAERTKAMNLQPDKRDWLREGRAGGMFKRHESY